MDWKQELLKRLDALAEKLGTTGAHLWAVLVRQGVMTGYADAGVAVVFLAISVALFYMGRSIYKKWQGDANTEGLALLTWGGSLTALLIAGVNAYDALLELGNPEFFALTKIMETFGK